GIRRDRDVACDLLAYELGAYDLAHLGATGASNRAAQRVDRCECIGGDDCTPCENRQAPYAGNRVRGVDDPRPSLDPRELGPAFIDDDGGRVCGTAVDADDQSITAHPMLLLREPARVGGSR